MCVCVFVCIYTWMTIYSYTFNPVNCDVIYLYTNEHIHIYLHIYPYICIHTYVYMYMCIYVYMYICIYIYIYIHVDHVEIFVCVRVCTRVCKWSLCVCLPVTWVIRTCDMSHTWKRHVRRVKLPHPGLPKTSYVPHMNETCSTKTNHVPHMNESCCTHQRVMSHIWMSHAPHINESCPTYEWVMHHM